MNDQWAVDAVEQTEKVLRDQRAQVSTMLAELEQLQEALHGRGRSEELVEENRRLRQALEEIESQAAINTPIQGPSPEQLREFQELKNENQTLHRLLKEKDQLLDELQNSSPGSGETRDLDGYEAELNRFRQQLEGDRQKLNQELQQLRVRNQEVDEATREMEMEFSRERADLARERTRLERLREEIRGEMERLQRDAGLRGSLASVQRLREGINQPR